MWSGIVFGLLAALYCGLTIGSSGWRVPRRMPNGHEWAAPFREALKRSGAFERLQPMLQNHRLRIAALEGECTAERLLRWVAESAAMAYAACAAAWALASIAGNPALGGVGSLVGICIPMLRARDLNRQTEERKRGMLMELPVLLSRLLVLVHAGEPVRQALARCLEHRSSGGHPLYAELQAAVAAMERGESMSLALEEFGRRCAIPEAKLFAAVLLMNAKRGGESLVPALRDLTRQTWEKRKAAARTLGEQASSRLAFPLAVIFLLIIVLVGAPAIFVM